MKNNKKEILVLMCFFSVLFFNCKKEDNNTPIVTGPPSNQSPPFFTFGKTGNSWIINISTTNIIDTLNFKLIEKLNNICKFQITHFDTPDTVYIYWYISDCEFAFSNDSLGNDRQTLLKSDAAVNSTYYYVTFSDSTINKVISTSVSVTVPAGTFNCYKIMETHPQQPDTAYYYINREAGIVKITGNWDNYVFKMLSKNF